MAAEQPTSAASVGFNNLLRPVVLLPFMGLAAWPTTAASCCTGGGVIPRPAPCDRDRRVTGRYIGSIRVEAEAGELKGRG
ncbi:hypothetical protein BRADI_1g09611v3 [Brachypodium distachyon]|uniref:Uncharacterized protein n=1 Tax=Brachypodium distachyon TaxID=15368 RepID=A0A2K2DIU0_BRADI|nr:hypothetical protein BRADI_1g09611v3 [Brachypodium distachyon]